MMYSSPKFIKIFLSSLPLTVLTQIEASPSNSLISTLIFFMAHTHESSLPSPYQNSCQIPIPFIVPKDQSQSANCEIFLKAVSCYGFQLLAPRPINKLLFTTCLFSILTGTFLTWKPSPTYEPEVWPLRPVKDAFTLASDTIPLLFF